MKGWKYVWNSQICTATMKLVLQLPVKTVKICTFQFWDAALRRKGQIFLAISLLDYYNRYMAENRNNSEKAFLKFIASYTGTKQFSL